MKYKFILAGILILALFSTPASAIEAPNNYSQYMPLLFVEDMGGWDFMENFAVVWTSLVGASIFWIAVLIIPYISMYGRQNGVGIVAVIYLFSGATLASVMPDELGPIAFWMLILAILGIAYHTFIGD